MSIRDGFLGVLDTHRAALNTVWDLRRYDVVVRVTRWTPGSVPGEHGAAYARTDTPLLVGGARPKVEQVSQRDVIASGGTYQDQDLKIGPLTPASANYPSGVDPVVFDPLPTGGAVEVLFKVTGPGHTSGAWFKKVGQAVDANFRYVITVRKTGAQDP